MGVLNKYGCNLLTSLCLVNTGSDSLWDLLLDDVFRLLGFLLCISLLCAFSSLLLSLLVVFGLTLLDVVKGKTNKGLEDLCRLLDELLGQLFINSDLLVCAAPSLGPTKGLCTLTVVVLCSGLVGCEDQEL